MKINPVPPPGSEVNEGTKVMNAITSGGKRGGSAESERLMGLVVKTKGQIPVGGLRRRTTSKKLRTSKRKTYRRRMAVFRFA